MERVDMSRGGRVALQTEKAGVRVSCTIPLSSVLTDGRNFVKQIPQSVHVALHLLEERVLHRGGPDR